jgi:hypothetical protein
VWKVAGSKINGIQGQEKSSRFVAAAQMMASGVMLGPGGFCNGQCGCIGRDVLIINLNVGGSFGHGFTACPNLFQQPDSHRFFPAVGCYSGL